MTQEAFEKALEELGVLPDESNFSSFGEQWFVHDGEILEDFAVRSSAWLDIKEPTEKNVSLRRTIIEQLKKEIEKKQNDQG